jgi:hypothetical protein
MRSTQLLQLVSFSFEGEEGGREQDEEGRGEGGDEQEESAGFDAMLLAELIIFFSLVDGS